ncbi:MAG: VOC family protein [Desulfobacterales bacterium]
MKYGIKTANTILYCTRWEETVSFYRDVLGLRINFSNDWFTEFLATDTSRISIADENRASVKSCGGGGITLALEADDIEASHRATKEAGAVPSHIKEHPWGARVFYVYDPEGHRVEIWQAKRAQSARAE